MRYHTGLIAAKDLAKFRAFIDREIGTEYEETADQSAMVLNSETRGSFDVFDLNSSEVEKLRAFESTVDSLTGEKYQAHIKKNYEAAARAAGR